MHNVDPFSPLLEDFIRRYAEGVREGPPHEQNSSGEVGATIRGQFRLRLFDQAERDRLKLVHPEWEREDLLAQTTEYDSTWTPNVVTDFGRRYLVTNAWGTTFNLFIAQATNPGTVRRTSIQLVYASQVPSQTRAPDSQTLDPTLLLQTRTVEFPAPSVARVINMVGLTPAVVNVPEGAIHDIVAYTHLSSTVNESTSQAADLQYKVSWSLS